MSFISEYGNTTIDMGMTEFLRKKNGIPEPVQQPDIASRAAAAHEARLKSLQQMPAFLDIKSQVQSWASESFGFAPPQFGHPQMGNMPMPMNANFGAPSMPWNQPWSLFFRPCPSFNPPGFGSQRLAVGDQRPAVEGAWGRSQRFMAPQPMALFENNYNCAGAGQFLDGYMS